jgi:hypothetical protein
MSNINWITREEAQALYPGKSDLDILCEHDRTVRDHDELPPKGGYRGKRLFENLRPFGEAIGGVIHGNRMQRLPNGELPIGMRHDLDSPSLDDRLAKQATKLARRAARAGHTP